MISIDWRLVASLVAVRKIERPGASLTVLGKGFISNFDRLFFERASGFAVPLKFCFVVVKRD